MPPFGTSGRGLRVTYAALPAAARMLGIYTTLTSGCPLTGRFNMTQLTNTTGASAPSTLLEGAGVRDTFAGTANPAPLGPSTPGYCYLEWFRPEHHAPIATKLGYNPWVPAVAAMMLANTGLLTSHRMLLTTAPALPTGGDKFTQWHVAPDPAGISVREFLALGLGAARLGGDTQRSAPEELLHVGRSTLTNSAGPAPRQLTLPFAATLQNDQAVSVRLPAVASWTTLLSPYESVVLTGFQFSADISGDESSVLRFRVATENTLANSRAAWLSAFYAKRFSGATGASRQGVWRLPADHPYGTELKATTLGTDPPVFQFHFAGASGDAEITGHLTVEPRGAAPPRPVTFNPTAHALA